ncbi:ferric-dicitrate binding protein FerR, regulates iron transport through sigma-19 [Catalinimonas alkaloidigena]|uniref:Ferric-dicitrate binding protein FerR, regulates iron transport through sigma-19 n=1 Tax=Catalinimonas alkaloidigena TaxID=1075417 RepID=A0A1G9IVC6_9BACT|nr:FecR domain-containing protein [Catalinimonas alkaloidigena]SDL29072.1 ferric-dicitrate binding protein FerR, regulates iron transport through sigma-19 [Catalinimonas alkaloidigena]
MNRNPHSRRKPTLFGAWWKSLSPEEQASLSDEEKELREVRFADRLPSEPPVSDETMHQDLARLQTALRKNAHPARPKARVRQMPVWVYRAAAVVSVGVMLWLAVLWMNAYWGETTLATGYGETREVVLSDGSRVMLNANSELRYPTRWDEGAPREVTLTGEAFFEIEKREQAGNKIKFIVHTEQLDVAVYGTSFNVMNRHDQTEVVLKEGSVHLNLKTEPGEIEMVPGDLVSVSAASGEILRKRVEPEQFSAWRASQLIFKATSLQQIAQRIEDIYGQNVVFERPALGQLELTGTFPADDLDQLLRLIDASSDEIVVVREGETIVFR